MKIIHRIIVFLYAFNTAYMAWAWAVHYAYRERGYSAVGGEYFLIPIVFIATYKIMVLFFRRLEERNDNQEK